MSFSLDTRDLRRAFQEYQKATKKDEADILNRAGRNVCLRAIKFTPRADAGKIKEQLTGAEAHRIVLARAAAAGEKLTREEITQRAAALVKAAVRSVGYIKAGWIKAARVFGGRPAGRLSEKGHAAEGYGKKASPGKLVAELANAATGADKVGLDALQRAVDFVAKDMLAYAHKKLAETARRHSAR